MPVPLKYGQGYQTWYKLLEPEQGYNHAKFERLPLNSVRQKANIKFFCQKQKKNTSIISLEYV